MNIWNHRGYALLTCGMEDDKFFSFLVPVIACGGEDCKVHLFTEKDNKVCKPQISAELFFGHSLGRLSKIINLDTCLKWVLFEMVFLRLPYLRVYPFIFIFSYTTKINITFPPVNL